MRTTLYTTDPNTKTGVREASFEETLAAARHALATRVRKGATLSSPAATRVYLMTRLASREHEIFTIIYLDTRS